VSCLARREEVLDLLQGLVGGYPDRFIQ
jgi:hypothetical protein